MIKYFKKFMKQVTYAVTGFMAVILFMALVGLALTIFINFMKFIITPAILSTIVNFTTLGIIVTLIGFFLNVSLDMGLKICKLVDKKILYIKEKLNSDNICKEECQ